MKRYENEDVRINSTPETVTIWFKHSNEILICEYRYLVSLSRLLGPQVDKIESNS